MYILMGLGNPGQKYEKNRHNVGFMFTDYFLNKVVSSESESSKSYSRDKYSDSELVKIDMSTPQGTYPILIAKPKTFMNKSGFSANKLLSTHNVPPTSLFVAHDDLDIKLGEFKIQSGKGPKVHNGLSSIESSLRFKDFWRIRIGIDNRESVFRMPGEPYVLQDFTADEKTILDKLFPIIFQKLQEAFKAQEQS